MIDRRQSHLVWINVTSSCQEVIKGFQGLDQSCVDIEPEEPLMDCRQASHLLANHLRNSIDDLRRIYLAGTGLGAVLACRLLLQNPETYRGAAMFNWSHQQLFEINQCHYSRRVLLAMSIGQPELTTRDALDFGRTLLSAGLQITNRYYALREHETLFNRMRLDLREWIIKDAVSAGSRLRSTNVHDLVLNAPTLREMDEL